MAPVRPWIDVESVGSWRQVHSFAPYFAPE
jgi:hypothetical protein